MFFLPNYNAGDDARKARPSSPAPWAPTSTSSPSSATTAPAPRQAMEAAAEVGDSWVFSRLSEELARTRWSGQPPWEALHALGDELGLPELDDFADIMRLSGEEGAPVYASLRARSAAMRTAMLNDEKAKANEVGERMTIPLPARRHLHGAPRRPIPAADVQQHLTTKTPTKGNPSRKGNHV